MLAPANKTNRCWMILILFWFASVFLVEHKVCMKLWLIDYKIHQKSPLFSHNVIRSKECLRWKRTKGKKVNSYLNSKRSKIGRQWCIIITFNIFLALIDLIATIHACCFSRISWKMASESILFGARKLLLNDSFFQYQMCMVVVRVYRHHIHYDKNAFTEQ